jgi:hypothetical protein
MRLFTSALCSAVAVGLLAGCSGGGLGSSVPSGSQAIAQAQSGMRFGTNVQRDASCASEYVTCLTVSKKTPGKVEICISSSGNCTSGSFPTYTWTQKIVTLSGKPFKSLAGSIKPKVGNPIEDTVKEKKKVASSGGAVKYVQDITACPTSGSCLDGEIGIITD